MALTRNDSSQADTGASRLFIGRDTELLTRPSTRPNRCSTLSRRASTELSLALIEGFACHAEAALDLCGGNFLQPCLVTGGNNELRAGLGERRRELATVKATTAGEHHHLVFQTELFEDVHKEQKPKRPLLSPVITLP